MFHAYNHVFKMAGSEMHTKWRARIDIAPHMRNIVQRFYCIFKLMHVRENNFVW
jgi:hypothetical protein